MSPKQIAVNLLRFRASTSLMVPGALAAEIGYPAMQDALQRNWIQPDLETGFLTLNPNAGVIQEMERLAESADESEEQPKKDENLDARRAACIGHSRRLGETYGLGLGATTSGAMGSAQPERPAAPQPQMSPTARRPGDDYMVGEDVVVADEGKAYQAKIKSRRQDGTYELTFGPNFPSTKNRAFRREEMQKVAPAGSTKPNTVQVQS